MCSGFLQDAGKRKIKTGTAFTGCTCFQLLLMASLAFHRAERRLAVMTTAAEFTLVNIIHLHSRAALFELKDSGVAAIAFQHRCMELVAEDRRGLAAGRIREFLFKRGHLMAFCAVRRGKSLLAVVTASA